MIKLITLKQRNEDLKRYEKLYRLTGDNLYLIISHNISRITKEMVNN